MAVPDFQSLTLPVLRQFADGSEHATKDVRALVAAALGLTPEDLLEILPSGTQTRFANRVAWAHVYMKRAGLLSSPRRGIYQITERGKTVLSSPPRKIDIEFLNQYPEMAGFRSPVEIQHPVAHSESISPSSDSRSLTPDEQVHVGAARIKENLVAQILERIRRGSPAAFEKLVVDVLVAMGYGGSHEDAAEVVGKSGDGGIDGVIKEDRLGFESIYVQAKRWEGSVGRPVIQQFVGALHERKARKGVVITASTFTREAVQSAKDQHIKLIDGVQLAEYMIEFGVGVSDVETIKLQRLDEDYFSED
jgi:restriction system protein